MKHISINQILSQIILMLNTRTPFGIYKILFISLHQLH